MKTIHRNLLAAAGLAVSAAIVGTLSMPTTSAAFSFVGGNLGLTQRDFRVWNNFTDVAANDNTQPSANFPGQTGAVLAIWKGESEWASTPVAGNGQGDGLPASNPVIGSGGANFDTTFQGTATSQPGNSNVHKELAGSSGGVLAFTITPIADGWTISYYSSWTWQDGPGSVFGGIDIQGVACHEIGHSLGLGHSTVGGATMFASVSGTGTAQRSIEADDIAGIQAIYGVKSASKPAITGLGGSTDIGKSLQIFGSNFSDFDNEVWFTKADPSDGIPVKVTGVGAGGGGTFIAVTVPFGVQDGEVLVKNSAGSTGANLSNAFPIDIGGGTGGQFITFGQGVPGLAGVPILVGAGDLTPGSAVGFTLTTSNTLGNQVATMYFSAQLSNLPFKGGSFYCAPVLVMWDTATDFNGQIHFAGIIPASTPPGLSFYCQTWIHDIFAIQDFSSTNGLQLVLP